VSDALTLAVNFIETLRATFEGHHLRGLCCPTQRLDAKQPTDQWVPTGAALVQPDTNCTATVTIQNSNARITGLPIPMIVSVFGWSKPVTAVAGRNGRSDDDPPADYELARPRHHSFGGFTFGRSTVTSAIGPSGWFFRVIEVLWNLYLKSTPTRLQRAIERLDSAGFAHDSHTTGNEADSGPRETTAENAVTH